MKDIRNLTPEEEEEIFALLIPMGLRKGTQIHRGYIISGQLIDAPKEKGVDAEEVEET